MVIADIWACVLAAARCRPRVIMTVAGCCTDIQCTRKCNHKQSPGLHGASSLVQPSAIARPLRQVRGTGTLSLLHAMRMFKTFFAGLRYMCCPPLALPQRIRCGAALQRLPRCNSAAVLSTVPGWPNVSYTIIR